MRAEKSVGVGVTARDVSGRPVTRSASTATGEVAFLHALQEAQHGEARHRIVVHVFDYRAVPIRSAVTLRRRWPGTATLDQDPSLDDSMLEWAAIWKPVGGLPVQHRLVQPSSQQVDADLSYLVGGEAKDLLVGAVQSKSPSGPTM